MLLISPSGFHQSCPSPNFILLTVSVDEGEGSLCPGQQRSDPTVNQVIMRKLGGRGAAFHAIANDE